MEVKLTRSSGGIVLSERGEVALVRHRISNGSWLFPKGHLEEGEDDEAAARREIAEEAGLTNLEYIDDLGSYERYHLLPDGTEDLTELKTIQMFLFTATPGSIPFPSAEMDGARWVPLTQVASEIGSVGDRAWFARTYTRVREAVQRD